VKHLEYSKIDKQGRIFMPERIREMVGIEGETEVLVRVEDGRIVIEPIPGDLEGRVEEWVRAVLSIKIEPSPEVAGGSWKWMSEGYARRKLCIQH
jgi:looped-hinge helix DNA binding domain, AbrB family